MMARRRAAPAFSPRGRGARGSTLHGRRGGRGGLHCHGSSIVVLLLTVFATVLLADTGCRFRSRRLLEFKVVCGARQCLWVMRLLVFRARRRFFVCSCFYFGPYRRSPSCPRGCLFCWWAGKIVQRQVSGSNPVVVTVFSCRWLVTSCSSGRSILQPAFHSAKQIIC